MPGPRTLAAVEQDRDPDLVTLEGLESELGELDAELAQTEREDVAPSGD
jgi:hypothetical protein